LLEQSVQFLPRQDTSPAQNDFPQDHPRFYHPISRKVVRVMSVWKVCSSNPGRSNLTQRCKWFGTLQQYIYASTYAVLTLGRQDGQRKLVVRFGVKHKVQW